MAGRIAFRFKKLLSNERCKLAQLTTIRVCSFTINRYDDRDPAPVFFDTKVQNILKRLTGANYDKVFRKRMHENELKVPEYKFLTDEELQEYMKKAKQKAEEVLQMPPVMKERKPITEVISQDPALTGYDTCKILVCDITFGLSDRKRPIFARDPDGTLRHASWEERERMNQIYNPQPGRKLIKPKMFLDENLKDVIAREKYEFILDRACAQFEPDDPDFQRVTSMTYEAINEKRHYQMLHSTRHFGPMCFYLAWFRKMDSMLIDLIQKEKLVDSAGLVRLYHHIHRESKSASLGISPDDHIEFVTAYIEEDSLRRPQLQLALQGYKDLIQEREQYEMTVQASHGLQ